MKTLEQILTVLRLPWQVQSDKALGINCPFCPDTKFHCGVFRDLKSYHCFRCGRSGRLSKLFRVTNILSPYEVRDLLGTVDIPEDMTVAESIMEKFAGNPDPPATIPGRPDLPDSYEVTPTLVDMCPELGIFLTVRDINVSECDEYNCRYTATLKPYPYRLVIPIFDSDGIVLSWQARDVTGRAKAKYISCPNVPINGCLYWMDYMGRTWEGHQDNDDLYVVEGIFDAWRLEYNAVATFGRAMTATQRNLLVKESPRQGIILAWDADAYGVATEAAEDLACLRPGVGVVRLPKGMDPDEMGGDAVRRLKVKWLS